MCAFHWRWRNVCAVLRSRGVEPQHLCKYPTVCVSHLPQHKAHMRQHQYPKPQNLTWRSWLSNTARNVLSQTQVLFHAGNTSDALFEWKSGEHSLGHCLMFCLCSLPPPPPPPNFQISPVKKATLSLKMFHRKCSIRTSFSDFVYNVWTIQYAASITRCFLAWSETSGSSRWGLACELLFVASGCFQSERGHCHRLKVLIYQHWAEATM